jgi:hypothetical protein
MKGHYFNRLKSVGVKFSDHFKEISKNKTQWPEITVPIVALTSTSVYLLIYSKFVWTNNVCVGVCHALLEGNGSPSKFNFTGNLFSEVYFFHVKFLKDIKVTTLHMFHKMMANIFEAIQ